MRGGGYRVFLSDEDLKQWGLDFASLDSRSPATRALLSAVSLIVRGSDDWDSGAMEIEALPVEGGCFLLLTPTRPVPLKPKWRRAASPLVYRVPDADALFGLAAAVAPSGQPRFAAESLYAFADGYRLVLYPFEPLSAPVSARLSEWAEPAGVGHAAAAFVAEHGKPILIGNVLQRLHELH